MDVRFFLLFILLGVSGCSESIEQVNGTEALHHISGVKFYEQRCAICHGKDGKLGVSEAKDLSKSKLTNLQIEDVINKGKGAMPPFKQAIESDSTLIELVDYIKTLRE